MKDPLVSLWWNCQEPFILHIRIYSCSSGCVHVKLCTNGNSFVTEECYCPYVPKQWFNVNTFSFIQRFILFYYRDVHSQLLQSYLHNETVLMILFSCCFFLFLSLHSIFLPNLLCLFLERIGGQRSAGLVAWLCRLYSHIWMCRATTVSVNQRVYGMNGGV